MFSFVLCQLEVEYDSNIGLFGLGSNKKKGGSCVSESLSRMSDRNGR